MKRAVAVYTAEGFQALVGAMRREFHAEHYLRVMYSTDKPRTLPQNAMIHGLYGQISRELGEQTVQEVRCECKLVHGVPILRAEDEEFRQAYDCALRPLQYEQKLIAMRFWPVTSLMNTSQLSRYVEAIERAYVGRVDLRQAA